MKDILFRTPTGSVTYSRLTGCKLTTQKEKDLQAIAESVLLSKTSICGYTIVEGETV